MKSEGRKKTHNAFYCEHYISWGFHWSCMWNHDKNVEIWIQLYKGLFRTLFEKKKPTLFMILWIKLVRGGSVSSFILKVLADGSAVDSAWLHLANSGVDQQLRLKHVCRERGDYVMLLYQREKGAFSYCLPKLIRVWSSS